jgi:hypothetical protein
METAADLIEEATSDAGIFMTLVARSSAPPSNSLKSATISDCSERTAGRIRRDQPTSALGRTVISQGQGQPTVT